MNSKIFSKSITVKKNKKILSVKKDRHVVAFRVPIDKAFMFGDRLEKEGLTVTQFGRAVIDGFLSGSIKIGATTVKKT